ncbi:olfactomedin-like protein 2B isoform X2 [Parambassis ranga]|uniref:Olfactomedin-like protein 2B isoform X2 n=1 Tax=Parambassis ranga TaxID=210632 RepID=A0A6P7K2F1_9TELE|nr:olfactomedin-like protein 2B isoform X2 [Parambassis ranga]
MWRRLSVGLLVCLCCAVHGLSAQEEGGMLLAGAEELSHETDKNAPTAAAAKAEASPPGGGERRVSGSDGPVQRPTAEPLRDELDNQENIISQLLGDYDKVKTVSSGSDCVCQCIVRPIKRSDCSRILDPTSASQDFYTVETVTKGTDCKKCVCMAPPSAVNPCEGEYRFKKLQEASKDDIKLATIIDLLEGSLYGLDLLKLHSVTTKLLTRVDNMEKAFTRNFTERVRDVKDKGKEKEKKAQQKKKKVNDLDRSGPKSGAAAYKQNFPLNKNQQQDGVEQQQPFRNETETKAPPKEKTEPRQPIKDKNTVVVRGVTFYKSEDESFREEGRGKAALTTNASVQLPNSRTLLTKSPGPSATFTSQADNKDPSPSHSPTVAPTTSHQTKPAPTTIKQTTPTTTATTTAQPSTPVQTQLTTSTSDTNISKPILVPPVSQPAPKSRLSWTESPADQPKTTKKPGVCKDTVASISEPVQQNSYGLTDGAWMKDARGHGSVIYLTVGHSGNSLLEFRDTDTFKSGQASNSYKLPYHFSGTGHVVYNGAFYYNRAYSSDIIRYDLRHRYVAAWTTLLDAILEEQAHRTQTEVEFAVDESGLWVLYPALDTEGFHQEVILLIHLHPRDLQPIRSFRTGLRRSHYGNSFLVCGVLYAVDSIERHHANVTYAFDTHTLTHTVPRLAFTNMHGHTSQLSYCPLDKKLYAWDDGHQMTYDVIFAY